MVPVRQDKRAQELRLSAKAAKDGKVVQRLLGIALILDGRGRSEAASLVGLDPQTLARAVQHYNADGIAGLKDRTSPGRPPKLTREQSAELKRMILAGPEDRDNGCPEYKVRHIVDLVKDKWGIGIIRFPEKLEGCSHTGAGLPMSQGYEQRLRMRPISLTREFQAEQHRSMISSTVR